MSKLILPPHLRGPETWTDCELLEQPRKEPGTRKKDNGAAAPFEPRLLVRRRTASLVGTRGEELICLPGPAAISLFTGCGGMDIGLEHAGMCTVVQHEWSADACKTLICNRPNYFAHSALIQGDLRLTPTEMILEAAQLRVGEAHVLTGGPPCQGFSYSNSNRGKSHDERNDLVYEFLRVIREAKPHYFIMENVPGFVELNKGEYFKKFLRTAYDSFYELVYGLLDAVEYSVPQYRCRFFCMGTRRDVALIDGLIAGMPSAVTFDERDLEVIKSLEVGPLFEPELQRMHERPGVRYFPDRPVLTPPPPIVAKPGVKRDSDDGGKRVNPSYLEFYRKLEREEPDRIVRTGRRIVA